jgi:hypothetical protein
VHSAASSNAIGERELIARNRALTIEMIVWFVSAGAPR